MTTASYAQTFRVKAGLNLSNALIKDDTRTYSDDFNMNPGFHVGATVEFPITELFSFETGLLLSTKGFKSSSSYTLGSNLETNLFYIDIPLTAKASFDLGAVKIYGIFGPYIGIGLSGKTNIETTSSGDTKIREELVKWGLDEGDYLKRFDFGLTMGAGVEISSILIGLSYNLGLANVVSNNNSDLNTASNPDNNLKINTRVLAISLGYKFGGK